MQPYDNYPTLDVYFGSYLHQDWMHEFSGPWEALDALLLLMEPSDLQRILDEIARLLALETPELVETMHTLSRYFDARSYFDIPDRQWLESLRDRVAAELRARTVSDR